MIVTEHMLEADDAVLIDSTNKSIEQVVNEIVYLMKS